MPYVNVYEVGRAYGGPEEGGWWFDTGEPILSRHCSTREIAEAERDILRDEFPRTGRRNSVLGGEDYEVAVEQHPGRAYPDHYPRYE